MTILSIVTNACSEIGIKAPSTVVGNTADRTAVQMLALVQRTGKELRSEYQWPQLIKEGSITTTTDTQYTLPTDFESWVRRTHWDQTNKWELVGPLTPQEWQWRQNGIVASFPRTRYRIRGYQKTSGQFFIDPTPTSGDVYVYEYVSTNWVFPKQWAVSTVYTASSYVSNDGLIYFTTAGGTSASSGDGPTGTGAAITDGTVTWAYQDIKYETFLADTDFSLVDEELITLGVEYRYLAMKGQDYSEVYSRYQRLYDSVKTKLSNTETISWAGPAYTQKLGFYNVPDSGFGT